MISVKDIDRALSCAAPRELSESWDNDGIMLCRSGEKAVKKVLCMLEVSARGADFAVRGGYDAIVTHHPFIFRPLANITGQTYAVIEKLMKADISVLSYHTRLDAAEDGVNTCIAELLGLCDVRGFGGETENLGRIGKLEKPMTPEDFGAYLKEKFGCGTIRASLFETEGRKIENVAVVGGAGKGFFRDAYKAGADAYVTSEAAHNTFIDCKELDMCLYDCGHYYTENAVCEKIKKILEQSFDGELSVDIYDVGSPYLNI